MSETAADLWLNVHDVKQWRYCHRIVFYDRVMPVTRKATFKMGEGHRAEAEIGRLEKRRKLTEYGLADGQRHFHLALRSTRLRLSGTIDLVVEGQSGAYPIDFKFTDGPVRANHVTQLAAYALLIEEALGRFVDRGFVYLVPQDTIEPVELTVERKTLVIATLDAIRAAVASAACPDPTPVRARCAPCEFRNYCADVF